MRHRRPPALIAVAAGLAIAEWPAAATVEPLGIDVLDLGAGAAVVRHSSEYADSWSAQWSALALLDSTTSLGWCSQEGAPLPHWFVIELPATITLERLRFSNLDAQEASNPGISARAVEIHVSTTGPDAGFRPVGHSEVARGGATTIDLDTQATAKWLEIVIRSNWGHANTPS